MTRPQRHDLDYVAVDCGWHRDIKVRKLVKRCGQMARYVYIDLVLTIGETQGYYMDAEADDIFIFCEDFGHDQDFVERVIEVALDVELFDFQQFKRHHILTSARLQRDYRNITRRRVSSAIDQKYEIEYVDSMSTETELLHTETEFMSTETPFMSTETELLSTDSTREIESKSKRKRNPPLTPPLKPRQVGQSRSPSPLEKSEGVKNKISKQAISSAIADYGADPVEHLLAEMDDYCASTGRVYADYDAALRSWIRKRGWRKRPAPRPVCSNPDCDDGVIRSWYRNSQGRNCVSERPCPTCHPKEAAAYAAEHQHQKASIS